MDNVFTKMAEEYRAKGEWLGFLDMRRHIDADRGVSALNELPATIPDDEYHALVRRTYTWSREIWENHAGWLEIFKGTKRALSSITSKRDQKKLARLPDPLTVHRGCCEHNSLGLSWTLDRERAERFAALTQEWTKAKCRLIVSGQVTKNRIVGYITTRNEEEIVVLPENVTNVTTEDITHLAPMTESMIKNLGKNSK